MKKYQAHEIAEFVSHRAGNGGDGGGAAQDRGRKEPRISIVTPSFNQAQFLERTILSVLNQNYPDLEFIIIDGGSTDGSVEIIRKYERSLAYWVSERDAGQSDALNKGFARATGEIVGWQNSDDIYLPGACRDAADALQRYPDVDVVFGNRLDIDGDDKITGETRFTPFSVIGYWYDGMSLSTQSTFWRRSLFSKVGMIDPSYDVAMDYEFFLRAALRGARFKHVRRYWGASRRHDLSKEATRLSAWWPEQDRMDRTYGRKQRWNAPLRTYSRVRRALYYLWLGDWDFVADSLTREARRAIQQLRRSAS